MSKIAIFGWVLAALLLAGCAGQGLPGGQAGQGGQTVGPPPAVPSDYAGKTNPLGPESAAAGKKTFVANCAPCHGESGQGDGPAAQAMDPHPANLVKLAPTVGDDFLFWRINTGVSGTGMPAWKGILTDQQIWEVISYIRSLK